MMRLFEVWLFLPEEERAVSSFGSLLHGALMERLPKELVERLHEPDIVRTVRVFRGTGRAAFARWRIGVVGEEVGEAIGEALRQGDGIFLRQKGYEVRLGERKLLAESSFEEIADTFFLQEAAPKGAELSFCTPTSFKREGRYVMLPDFFLICSLLMRWNRFAKEIYLYDEDLTERMALACQLSKYALRSVPFSIEGHTIRGFCGTMRVRFFDTDGMRRILGMLFSFAPFVGIGIKTALGMGAAETRVWER